MKKGFALSAYADNNPDHLRFRRQHSGDAPEPAPRLRPLWPPLVVALVLLIAGLNLILRGANAGVAMGGLFFCLLAVAVLGFVAWEMLKPQKDAP